MHVEDVAALGVERGVEEPVLRGLLHHAGHQRAGAGRFDQPADLRPGRIQGQVGNHVAEKIARQRQLRKNDQVGPLPAGGLDLLQVHGQISSPVAEQGRDLSQGDAKHSGPVAVCRLAFTCRLAQFIVDGQDRALPHFTQIFPSAT